MSERAPYSRVYWSIRDDAKFDTIRGNDHHLATWLRLLIAADMAYPASADLPANAKRASVKALVDAGLVDLVPGSMYRIHGLDSERERRRIAATTRGPNGTPTVPRRSANGHLDETRRDETSTSLDITPNPAERGHGNPRAMGTNPRAVADREREAKRLEVRAIRQRYYAGEISEVQMDQLVRDVGKEPDDLTRRHVS